MKDKPIVSLQAVDFERIAQSIRTAAEMGKKLKACGLKQRTVALLLQDATGVSRTDIKLILDALPLLAAHYTEFK